MSLSRESSSIQFSTGHGSSIDAHLAVADDRRTIDQNVAKADRGLGPIEGREWAHPLRLEDDEVGAPTPRCPFLSRALPTMAAGKREHRSTMSVRVHRPWSCISRTAVANDPMLRG
jgi:hypothetical protein